MKNHLKLIIALILCFSLAVFTVSCDLFGNSADKTSPSVKPTPDGELKDPTVNDGKNDDEDKKDPSDENQTPSGTEKDPSGENQTPSGTEKDPSGENQTPSGTEKDPSGENQTPSGTEKDPSDPLDDENNEDEGECVFGNEFKVALICLHDENSSYDKAFMSDFNAVCKQFRLKKDQILIATGVNESSDCYKTACKLAKQNCKYIFATSYGHSAYLAQAAEIYPDIHFFTVANDANSVGLKNYHNVYTTIYEGAYLGGMAAGEKLNEMIKNGVIDKNSAKLGYVACYEYAEVISHATAFYLGAKSVCPTATMNMWFTDSWYSYIDEQKAAKKLIESGAVVLTTYCTCSRIPYDVCTEAKIPAVISTYADEATLPFYSDIALGKFGFDWTNILSETMSDVAENKEISDNIIGTLKDGSVTFEPNKNLLSEEALARIREAKESLAEGKIRVFDVSSFTVNGNNLTSYSADVIFDLQFTPDTQVILTVDGITFFAESYFRAFPYFDIFIDGITLLNSSMESHI